MASIKDVAQAAGVSVSTVSHVINQTRFVSAEATGAVQKAIADLGYRPSYLARALKQKRTKTIGMLVSSSTNPFFAEVVGGFEEGCYRDGYTVLLGISGDQPGRRAYYMKTLTQERIDAIAIMTIDREGDRQSDLAGFAGIPKIVLDSEAISDGCAISDDSVVGGRLATQFLLDAGHRRIGCVTGPQYHSRSIERFQGFSQAMVQAQIPLEPSWLAAGDLTAEGGYRTAKTLLQQRERPTALFAFNDLMAVGAYRAAREVGLSIPEDLSIIGYDDIEFASLLTPSLTTIRQRGFQIGLDAAELLIHHLESKAPLPSFVQRTPELVIRESVQRLR